MEFTHLTAADCVRQRWRNGGGTTAELARHPDGERWLWRASIADVERSGPFSDFTGYRRVITLLEGRGMRLTFDRAPPAVVDQPYRPFVFDGGWRTECRLLDGPIRDMNLIVDDARIAAGVDIRMPDEAESLEVATSEWTLLHAIGACFEVRLDDKRVTLEPGDTLRVSDAPGTSVSATALNPRAVLAVMTIGRRR